MTTDKAAEIIRGKLLPVTFQDCDDPDNTEQKELVESLLLAMLALEFCADLEKQIIDADKALAKKWLIERSSLRNAEIKWDPK